MGAAFPGKSDHRSAPYQQVYTSFGSAINLTEALTQCKNACSGLVVMVGASGAGNFVWKDCAGNTNTLALANSAVVDLPFAALSIEASTITGSVVVYWHSTPPR